MPTRPADFTDCRKDAAEMLSEHGYEDATVVLVRSPGQTYSGYEELWFLDAQGRRRIAYIHVIHRYKGSGKNRKAEVVNELAVEFGW